MRILAKHPATGQWLAQQLVRWFISDTAKPSESLLAPLAKQLTGEGNTAKGVEMLLRSNLFFSAEAYRQKVRSPVELALGIIRPLEGRTGTVQLAADLARLGQELYEPPTISGWAGGLAWINPLTMLGRAKLAEALLAESGAYEGKLDPAAVASRHGHPAKDGSRQFLVDLYLQGDLAPEALEALAAGPSATGSVDARAADPRQHRSPPRLAARISTGLTKGSNADLPERLFQRHRGRDGSAGIREQHSGIPGAINAQRWRLANHRPESVLVVIQLSGGNDGLNTVVPYQDDAYHRSRPTLRIGPDQVLKLDSGLGLHPAMPAFRKLYQEGRLSIIQGVGYPHSSRDHDAAMEDWHTGVLRDRVPPGARTGWLGRAIDAACDPAKTDLRGVFVGEIKAPFSLQTERVVVPSIKSLDEWLPAGTAVERFHSGLTTRARRSSTGSPSLLAAVRNATANARLDSAAVDRSRTRPSTPRGQPLTRPSPWRKTWPWSPSSFGPTWASASISSELGGGGIGGFDTHANQAANHGALLRELAESTSAFVDDLNHDRLLDSVLVMTFSEFGRTLTESGRRGTNHGAAAPMFMIGGKVKGGLWGAHPSLTDLEEDAPKFHTDFRRVYATVLERWLNLKSEKILPPGFTRLDGVLA